MGGGARGRRGGGGANPFGGGGRTRTVDFTDIFGDLFGGGADDEPARGADIQAETTIDFRDAILGTTMALTVNGDQIRVKIPEGIRDGQKIRVPRKNAPTIEITIHVKPHPFFERRGDDIHVEIPITVGEAIRGAEIDVPTIQGNVRMRIPAGTQAGRTMRLSGKGVKKKGGGAGDQYNKIMVVVPTEAPAEAVDAIEQAYRENPRVNLRTTL